MRIISGKHKNRKLISVVKGRKSDDLRPSTEKARAAIFNIIASSSILTEDFLQNANVLDLFAGCGALGLESLSRGANSATFLDIDKSHLDLCRENAKILGELERCEFFNQDATRFFGKLGKQYSLIFIDPPYRHPELINKILLSLATNNLICEENIIFVEKERHDKYELPSQFSIIDSKRYGISSIDIIKFTV